MKKSQVLAGGLVALVCAAILVLFTDIELSLFRWVNCGPLSSAGERRSDVCR
jgi:hypothetical protein